MARRSCPDPMTRRSKSGVSGFKLNLALFCANVRFSCGRCQLPDSEEREGQHPQQHNQLRGLLARRKDN
eukprot:974036-Prymnesium_polylepis.1